MECIDGATEKLWVSLGAMFSLALACEHRTSSKNMTQRTASSGPEDIHVKLFVLNPAEHKKLLINLKLLTIANSFLLYIAAHDNFFAIQTTVGIFIFISRENFMLNWVKYEKSFITPGPCRSLNRISHYLSVESDKNKTGGKVIQVNICQVNCFPLQFRMNYHFNNLISFSIW